MKKMLTIFTTALMALFVLCTGALAQYRTPDNLAPWRGYAEICVLDAQSQPRCAYAQSVDLFDTREACMTEMSRVLDQMTREQPELFGRYMCEQDRSIDVA